MAVRLKEALKWAVRSAALLVLELYLGIAFYWTAIYSAMIGANIVWNLPDWQFLRAWEGEVAVAFAIVGAIVGSVGWLVLRYKVIQPALRWVGLAKRSEVHSSFGLKPAV